MCASVVPVEGAIVSEEEIGEWCGQNLAYHKVPDRVLFLDEFLMTGTGKVCRVDLAHLLEEVCLHPVT